MIQKLYSVSISYEHSQFLRPFQSKVEALSFYDSFHEGALSLTYKAFDLVTHDEVEFKYREVN